MWSFLAEIIVKIFTWIAEEEKHEVTAEVSRSDPDSNIRSDALDEWVQSDPNRAD